MIFFLALFTRKPQDRKADNIFRIDKKDIKRRAGSKIWKRFTSCYPEKHFFNAVQCVTIFKYNAPTYVFENNKHAVHIIDNPRIDPTRIKIYDSKTEELIYQFEHPNDKLSEIFERILELDLDSPCDLL